MEQQPNVQLVPLEDIHDSEEGFNSRGEAVSPLDVVELAKDIELNGLLQPVVVAPYEEHDVVRTGKKYKLIMGFRRVAAFKLVLQRDVISAMVKDTPVDELHARLMNLSENLQRRNLNILQEAKAVEKLYGLGLTVDQVANQLGMSYGWTQIRHMLMCLPEDVQQEAAIGTIKQTNIRNLFTAMRNDGEEFMYTKLKEIKTAKIRGEKKSKDKDIDLMSPRKARTTKMHRSRGQIFSMMEHIQDSVGVGFHTRCLAWAAGEVTDEELYVDIREYATDSGISYTIPPLESEAV